ncbi:MAG: sigma-54 interaction domain-containing protein [Bdellovibrionota bacterium]
MKPARPILGESQPIQSLLSMIRKVGPSKTNVLVVGESGTGKELVARMIHDSGPLKDRPFIPVNCGAIPENLIESEMFGHRRGSFTGAIADKAGLFEAANGGTLFLDEVGELPLGMQVKLLRAIQERSFRKVGGNEDVHVEVRIIAATNRDLETAVRKGTFREDLYYRLNVIMLRTPPLRERKSDIRLLAESFLDRVNKRAGKHYKGIDQAAMAAMEAHSWPGNVRELENVMERAATLEPTDRITLSALPTAIQTVAPVPSAQPTSATSAPPQEIRLPAPDFSRGPIQLDQILGEVEKLYLLQALDSSGGVKKKAAELLGITFRSIRYRLQKLGMDSAGDDSDGEK